MKKLYVLLVIVTCVSFTSFSQKKINDKTLNAQERRQVFIRWGDWQPPAKWVLGMQINQAHSRVWGWSGPSANRRYKNGSDIRPLAPLGTQTLRGLALIEQERISTLMVEETNELARLAEREILYHSSVTAKVDPLYLLYFSKTLKPIIDYNLMYFNEHIKNPEVFNYLDEIGVFDAHDRRMRILVDRLNGLFKSDMERGQRIIGYHNILEAFRKDHDLLMRHVNSAESFLKMKNKKAFKKRDELEQGNVSGSYEERDRRAAREIIERHRYNLNN